MIYLHPQIHDIFRKKFATHRAEQWVLPPSPSPNKCPKIVVVFKVFRGGLVIFLPRHINLQNGLFFLRLWLAEFVCHKLKTIEKFLLLSFLSPFPRHHQPPIFCVCFEFGLLHIFAIELFLATRCLRRGKRSFPQLCLSKKSPTLLPSASLFVFLAFFSYFDNRIFLFYNHQPNWKGSQFSASRRVETISTGASCYLS